MDPAKRASVGTRVEEQVKDWLRYGDDLGLGAVLSRPRAVARTAGARGACRPKLDRRKRLPSQWPLLPGYRARKVAPRCEASARYTRAARHRRSSAPTSLPSLFESIDRIADDTLPRIREDIGDCTRCKLHKGRTKIVFGVGNPKAELVFVGEGPGRDEDIKGEPFVGRAGKLLTQMIEAMSLRREDVYIANVVKCRPPENRLPEKDEIATCSPFLMRQLDVIKPKVICAWAVARRKRCCKPRREFRDFAASGSISAARN